MVTVNDPLIIALIFIVFLAAVKWMEWFLFRKEGVHFKKQEKDRETVHENRKSKIIGQKLKNIFVFGRADLKRPWYIVLPSVLNYVIFYVIFATDISFMSTSGWFLIPAVLVILMIWFDIFIMLRVNKEYFSVGDRKKRYLRVQAAQAALAVVVMVWEADRTQIGTVEGLPVYAGELESCACDIKERNPELTGIPAYKKAFEDIKTEKAFEKCGRNIDPEKIRYQIGDTYYKKLLLKSAT